MHPIYAIDAALLPLLAASQSFRNAGIPDRSSDLFADSAPTASGTTTGSTATNVMTTNTNAMTTSADVRKSAADAMSSGRSEASAAASNGMNDFAPGSDASESPDASLAATSAASGGAATMTLSMGGSTSTLVAGGAMPTLRMGAGTGAGIVMAVGALLCFCEDREKGT